MWYEVHWCKIVERWALYVGTEDGYRIDRLYTNKLTARISAKVWNYKFCNN